MIKKFLIIQLLALSIFSCTSNFIVKTEEQFEIVDGKKQVVSQIIKNLRISDSLPFSILTKTSNFSDDVRMKFLTGLNKESGLQDYLLDSIYYDKFGNDTLKKSFVNVNKKWQLTQLFHKKFNQNKNVEYFMTERPFNKKGISNRKYFISIILAEK